MIRALLLALLLAAPAAAQEFRALTRLDPAASSIEAGRDGTVEVALALGQVVPWRVFLKADPARLVVDLSEVDWSGVDADALDGAGLDVALGRVRPGWSRLVAALPEPMTVARAWMDVQADGNGAVSGAVIRAELTPATPEGFAAATGPLVAQDWDGLTAPALAVPPRTRQTGDRPLVVALDPGHGGIDPGAERDGVTEADLALRFARELSEVLRRRGHSVVLTRDDDYFVSLRGRGSIARAGGADLLISLHADAVEGGGARGATIYTLSEEATDTLGAELAARHARDDLVMGADLPDGEGDEVAAILVDLARAETGPRSESLGDALADGMAAAGLRMHATPRASAAFTVLKTPDIPSVLVELGYMSDARDLRNLTTHQWRATAAEAIAGAVDAWAVEDAAQALRVRR
ncbi:N-acetylmuramoyl-L-alanine amidase [Jannaschia sp. Os4]|uniref:N-acetylmuramoyl-L-alanine amidase n=1 Tax=Jannaschia sp. Os4 TaxID=2807617 RepID=UPI00193A4E5D|nr:N-acetylmuramoyl-L-alanine amidase [Jannaschia sp. Os4]MBM2576896.1 N-acetylmuramoyl-L-alanine amidase [Jannaschia sp. Os4]